MIKLCGYVKWSRSCCWFDELFGLNAIFWHLMWHPVIFCEKNSSSTEIPFQNVCPYCLFVVMANAGIAGVCFVERKVVAFYLELSWFLEEFGNVVAFHNYLLFFIQIPGQCMYCSHFQLQFLRPGSRYSVHVETVVDSEHSMLWMIGKYWICTFLNLKNTR